MSGRDDESCDIMRHHATPCDRERKRVESGWRKTSFVRRRCGRGRRWRERKRKRKTSGHRKRKGFPLQALEIVHFHNFIHTLQNLVKDLPESISEVSESDRLAVFGGSPKDFDNPTLDADDLCETMLNCVLKLALGWGTDGNMDEVICRGKWGLDGLVKFATYFVNERGVSEALFEGKLANLMIALKRR